jgi:hypothetical protein
MANNTAKTRAVGGQAVVDQVHDLENVLTPIMAAAALSKMNLLVVGEPGFGKTEIQLAMLQQMFGPDATFMLPCLPTTLPSDIVGFANPIYSVDPFAEAKGIQYWITKNTPVDPSIQACLLDEVSRLGDLGTDTLTHAMHDVSRYHRPLYVANANWITPTPRSAAFRDRFAMTMFYASPIVDVEGLIATPAISTWKFNLPTFDEIYQVRQFLHAYITGDPKSYHATGLIVECIRTIQRLMEGTEFSLNNRRVFQWRAMLYAMGCWASGTDDFDDLREDAFRALMYAYPVESVQQSLGWRNIVASIVDVVETEIQTFQANAYAAWANIMEKFSGRSGRVDASRMDGFAQELGASYQKFEEEIRRNHPNDTRVERTLQEMFGVYRRMLRGENPFKG